MEGRKEEQYKKSPYINNNNNNSNIEEMMSKMTINEKKEKEEGEKKWAEKEGEKKEIKPLWLKKLEELDSPFVNETIKGIIGDGINLLIENMYKVKEVMKDELAKFFHLSYISIFLDTDRGMDTIRRRGLERNTFDYFAQCNFINQIYLDRKSEDPLHWYKNSDPFCRIFEGKLCTPPKTEEEAIIMIKQIQTVMKLAHAETIMELDKNQYWLNELSNATGKLQEQMLEVKPQFVKMKDQIMQDKLKPRYQKM